MLPFCASVNSWNDPQNAELYDLFTRKHRLYRDASLDLVDLARLQNAGLVADLACGTGATTETILERLAPAGRIIAIDGSEAMAKVAQRRVPDPRVRWLVSDGSAIDSHVHDADAILCNSAIWQMDVGQTIAACARALRPDGRLVFNIGRGYLAKLPPPREPSSGKPTLPRLMQSLAARDYGFVPPPSDSSLRATRNRAVFLTLDMVAQMVRSAGLVPEVTEERGYDEPPEAQLDWFSIPVFAESVLTGMPEEQKRKVIAEAYRRLDKHSVRTRWLWLFSARKP